MWAATALLEQYKSVVNVHLESQLNAREHEASIADQSADRDGTEFTRDRRARFSLQRVSISMNNLLQQRVQSPTIVDIIEEMKGYKVELWKENRVIVTNQVKIINTLSDAQTSQLQHAMRNEYRDVTASDSIPSAASAPTAANNNDGTINTTDCKTSKKQWKRSVHGTRDTSKCAQMTLTQKESSASDNRRK